MAGRNKSDSAAPVAVNVASVSELVHAGLTRYMAGKVVSARGAFLDTRKPGTTEMEAWKAVKSWEAFWEALEVAGLRGLGPAKRDKLVAAGAYFGTVDINTMRDRELEQLLGARVGAAVAALTADPEQAEGLDGLAELIERLPVGEGDGAVLRLLVEAGVFAAPRRLSDLNDASVWTPEALDLVPGIGGKSVAKLVAARTAGGGFEDWGQVPLGDAKRRALVRAGAVLGAPLSEGEERVRANQPAIVSKLEQNMSGENGPASYPVSAEEGESDSEGEQDKADELQTKEQGQKLVAATAASQLAVVSAPGIARAEPKAAELPGEGKRKPSQSRTGRRQGQMKLEDMPKLVGEGAHTAPKKPHQEETPATVEQLYWWQQEQQSLLPFPAEFVECEMEDGGKCKRETGACVCLRSPPFRYRMLTEAEAAMGESEAAAAAARLHALYCKIPPGSSNVHRETSSFRSGQTGKEAIRQAVWRDLLLYEATDRIPKKWRDTFRVDPYGNVVALEASMLAVTAFEVDHIFPWSRGGLSVPDNFMALYWGANRHVKGDGIANAFGAAKIDRMQCGLSVDGFLELLAEGEAIPKRFARQKYFQQLRYLLLCCVGVPSNAIAVLQPGQVLQSLLQHHQAMLEDLFGSIHQE